MFWKSADLFGFKPKSLVDKLILFYSITTIAIVILVCIILFPSFEKIYHVINNNINHKTFLWEKCIEKLILALLVSSLGAIIFARIIARKSMSYIREFSEKIEKMTVDSLGKDKINPNDWPVELQTLGISLNNMSDKLQKSFNQLSQFSADIAHELRNPIHNLLGINEVALTRKNQSNHREILESNVEECRHLLKLIENLWFIARAHHGQTILSKKILQTKEEILNICDYYEPYASENEITIVCQGDALLYADPVLFRRVISNLLSNALRYTKAPNKIDIEIERSADFVSVSINDTGIGIEEIHLSKIFDRFYRIDSSRSTETGGLGLGLAIVKSIMDLHEGYINIQSKVNVGTNVQLRFPIQSA